MTLHPEHDDEPNFWPVYSDLAMIMVLLLLLFVLIQFVVNSKTLIHEAESVVSAQNAASQHDTDRRRLLQLTLEFEDAKRHIKDLKVLLEQSEREGKRLGAALAALSKKDAETIEVKEKLSQRQEAIAQALQKERGIQVPRIDGNLQLFTFSADTLFPPDDANLSPQGEELLQRFAQVLQNHPEYYTRIEVEGHADESPSSRYYKREDFDSDHGNWRLSAERAITVIQLFQKRGISGQRLAIVGRSHYDPVASERSREALGQNRRVQVRLFYSETPR